MKRLLTCYSCSPVTKDELERLAVDKVRDAVLWLT